MANINANKPLMPQRQNSHYVVVKEKHGGSSSGTAKTTASQNLKNAAKVSVLAQRTGKLGLPHYANGRNASIFGNRLSMQPSTYKGHVRSAESMYHNYRPTGSYSDMNAAMATAMAMQGLNAAMGLIGQGINAFKSAEKTDGNKAADGNNNCMGGPQGAEDSSYIAGMKNAKTSVELKEKIDDAQGRYDAIDGEIEPIQNEKTELEGKTDGLKQASADATKAYDDAKKEYDTKTKAKGDAETTAGEYKKRAKNCQFEIEGLEAQITRLQNQKGLDGEPIDNSAKISELKSKIAEKEKEKAGYEAKEKEYQKQADDIDAELKTMKPTLDKLENAKTAAEENLKDNLKQIEAKGKQIDKLKNEKTKLESEIKTQKKNLEKMKKAERDEYNKISKDLQKLYRQLSDCNAKINPEDGTDKKDERADAKAEKIKAEITKLEDRIKVLEPLVNGSSA